MQPYGSPRHFEFLSKFDIFALEWPQFNIAGREKLSTLAGGLGSLFIMLITFLYGSAKLMKMYLRENPTINNYMRHDAYTNNEKFNFKDENFMMAFALENF